MSGTIREYRQARKHRCRCGASNFEIARRGAHIGAWCATCGGWLKWLNSKERDALALPVELPEHDGYRKGVTQ